MGGLRTIRRAAVILGVALILSLPAPPVASRAIQPVHIPVAQRMAVNSVPVEAWAWEVSRGSGLPRGYILVAMLAKEYFPPAKWQTACAVSIAESCGEPDRIGDKNTPYPSVGLWQVRLVHTKLLATLTGSTDPAVWTRWLQDPGHNAEAAAIILRYGGWTQWGAYCDGRYRFFLTVSKAVLEETK